MMESKERPFTEFGQFGQGRLDLRVFTQDVYWVDINGQPHLLTEMSEEYRRNVIIHLLSNSHFFWTGAVKEQLICFIANRFGYEVESSFQGEVANIESIKWIEDSVLMKRLRELTPNSPTLDSEQISD